MERMKGESLREPASAGSGGIGGLRRPDVR
jgi:hypothetical protein